MGLNTKECLFRLEGMAVSIVVDYFLQESLFGSKSGEERSTRWVRGGVCSTGMDCWSACDKVLIFILSFLFYCLS